MTRLEREKSMLESASSPESVPLERMPQESLLQIVGRRYKVILAVVILSLIAGLIYLSKATPIFVSTSRLYVEQSGPKIISEQEGLMTQSKNYLYTQCELLLSTPIVSSVLEKPEITQLKTFENVDNRLIFLKKKMEVDVGKKDDIINVSLESPYPQEAAQIVNELVDAYITYHATTKRSTAAEVLRILQKEKDKRDQELTEKYQQILAFKQENTVLVLEDEKGNIALQGLARLQDDLTAARIETINAKAAFEATKLMMDDPNLMQPRLQFQTAGNMYLAPEPQENQLRMQIQQLESQLQTLRGKITADHPGMRLLEEKIAQSSQQLADLEKQSIHTYLEIIRQSWQLAQQRELELQTSYDQQYTQAAELNTKATQYAILQSELRRIENLCDIIDNRIKELNVTEDVGALNISILEAARPALEPAKPQKTRIMAMALVLGLMLGVGGALLLDWKDQRLHSADEISSLLGMPVLGTIQTMRGKETPTARGQLVHQEPTSPITEAYKTVRTAVYFGVPEGEAKTLLITSPAPGDGKSTLTSNLAIAMAQAGQRTLVLDADFRKPMQHTIFGLPQEPGLSNILAGRIPLQEGIRPTGVDRLDICCCGPIPVNPSELLSSRTFVQLIQKLSEQYDRILFDSPPVMPVTDARILGALCDVTLLVLRAEKSTRKTSEQARDGLLSVGSKVLGVVVNDVNPRKDRYGYYSGYGHYGYGYGHRSQQTADHDSARKPEPNVMTKPDQQDRTLKGVDA